ncbi:MAG: SDR family NAD(P)-dependent oxidoreductase [Alphaproteobacteria bacterium]
MRTVLITGGAGGLGSAVARRLAAAGDRIVVTDLDENAAQKVAAGLGAGGHIAARVDVADEKSVIAGFEAAEAAGQVSVLVACAGGTLIKAGQSGAIVDTSLDDWVKTEAFNARGAFLCVRELFRRRKQSRVENARAILFSSAAAQTAAGLTGVGYVASKASVLGLTKYAALEGVRYGITVNAIAPGPFDTAALYVTNPPDYLEAIKKRVPLGRYGTPDEMAALVQFIASPDAAYITGATFDINGGGRMA